MSSLQMSQYLELIQARVREPRALQGALSGRARRPIEAALVVPNVRGLAPERALLYPESLSVAEAVTRAAQLVDGGVT